MTFDMVNLVNRSARWYERGQRVVLFTTLVGVQLNKLRYGSYV